jgi:hypothetical protein
VKNARVEDFLNIDANFETEAAIQEVGEFIENHQQVWSKEEEQYEGTSQELQVEGIEPCVAHFEQSLQKYY